MELLLATNNLHKKEELSSILSGHTLLLPRDLGLSFEHEETGSTFYENSLGKARTLFQAVRRPVIADDSGLCVSALGGKPGLYTARFGGEGLSAEERNRYLLDLLKESDDRRAYFVCCMVLFRGGDRISSVQEIMAGEIAREPSGGGGFGYDPVFFLPEYGKTAAQLPEDEKNRISHRGRAAAGLGRLLD